MLAFCTICVTTRLNAVLQETQSRSVCVGAIVTGAIFGIARGSEVLKNMAIAQAAWICRRRALTSASVLDCVQCAALSRPSITASPVNFLAESLTTPCSRSNVSCDGYPSWTAAELRSAQRTRWFQFRPLSVPQSSFMAAIMIACIVREQGEDGSGGRISADCDAIDMSFIPLA